MTHASLFRDTPALVAQLKHTVLHPRRVFARHVVAQIKAYHHSIPLLAAQEVVDGKVVSNFLHR